MQSKDDKKLWNKINWSGSLADKISSGQANTNELSEHFKELYHSHPEDNKNTMDLKSDVYIPVTDDAISFEEMKIASKFMKKGG